MVKAARPIPCSAKHVNITSIAFIPWRLAFAIVVSSILALASWLFKLKRGHLGVGQSSCGGWLCSARSGDEPLPDWALHRRAEVGDYCDISVVDAGSGGMAWADKPFVVRGGLDLSGEGGSFSRQRLLEIARKGAWQAKWGTSDSIIANTDEVAQGPVTSHMEEFITRIMREPRFDKRTSERLESPYVFQRFPGKNFALPPVLRWLPWNQSFFMLGAEGSGASWHRHNAAVSVSVYGWKRWLLLPPEAPPAGGGIGFWSILEWLKVALPRLRGAVQPVECIVGPSDIIYVPENWYHAILNVRGDSISVSLQTSHSVTQNKKIFNAYAEANYRNQKNLSHQIVLLRRFLHIFPQDTDMLFSLGDLYLMNGDYKMALDTFSEIVRKDAFHIDAMYKIFSTVRDVGKESRRNAKSKEEKNKAARTLLNTLRSFEPLLVNNTDRSLMANYMLAAFYRLTKSTAKELEMLSRNADLQTSGAWFGQPLKDLNFSEMLIDARHREMLQIQVADEL